MRGTCGEIRPGVWRLRVVTGYSATGHPIQASRTFRGKKRAAESALARFVHEVEAKTAPLSGTMTVDQFLDEYLAHAEAHLSADTIRNYRSKAARFRKEIGRVRLDKLETIEIDKAYRKWLSEGMRPSTVRAHHAVISSAFRQAERWGKVSPSNNPVRFVTLPRVEPRPVTMPSMETIHNLVAATYSDLPVLSMAIILAALTGVRRGELLGLRWSDLDREKAILWVSRSARRAARHAVTMGPTKNRQARPLAVDPETIRFLDAYRLRCEQWAATAGVDLDCDAYIISPLPDGSEPWNPDALTAAFSRVAKRLGYGEVRFHDLRHAVASTMLGEGHDVAVVASHLGNTAQVTLRYYAHAVAERSRAAAGVMASKLLPALPQGTLSSSQSPVSR